jgi:hypothetical protein
VSRALNGAVVLAALLGGLCCVKADPEPLATTPAAQPSMPPIATPAPEPAPRPPPPAATVDLPELGSHAKRRVWARGRYGPLDDQYGRKRMDWEAFPPQGFAVTPDGALLVVDTGKERIVRYAADGALKSSFRLPKGRFSVAGDVAVTADGTIAVIDAPGSGSGGTLLLDASGREKGTLPQPTDSLSGVYAVGNDLYGDFGESSMKLGSAQGMAIDSPGTQQVEGPIAGRLAPDGETVLGFSIDPERGELTVIATRGAPPQAVFTRRYSVPLIAAVLYLQADAAGRIYAVVNYRAEVGLLCLDGRTGDPVGMSALPFPGSDTQQRLFNVAPQGGLVYAVARKNEVTFEVFDCHP